MIHEPLNITHWKSFFALERLQKEAQVQMPEANIISGPYDIAVLEQFRDASYANLPGIERIPTDVFIWSQGEPEQRAITKIGGLPYRRANQSWPVSPSGIPLTFAAQLCFIDSHDIMPPLPGDILLIFTEAKPYTFRGETFYDFMGEAEADSNLVFEWVSLTDSPLIAQHDIPASPLQIMPCYGSIYRTWDYPHVDGFGYPDIAEHIPSVLEATKIGGICPRAI